MNLQPANKNELRKKYKALLQDKKNWSRALAFLNFVILAFVFWLIQYYQQVYEIEKTIPVEYQDVPENIVLNRNIPKEITLKITDKGTGLLTYGISRRKDKIKISLKNIDLSKHTYLIDQSTLSAAIRNHLPSTVSLLSFYPNSIKIDYEPLVGKELPIVLDGKLSPAQGFMFSDSIRIIPPAVFVYSDKATLDTLSVVRTAEFNLTGIDKEINKPLALISPENVKLSLDEVVVKASVEEYTEKSFTLPVQCSKLPDNFEVRFFPFEVEVICYIPLSKYPELVAEDLLIEFPFQELEAQKESPSIPLRLSRLPEYVTHYRFNPEKVDFLIEQNQQ